MNQLIQFLKTTVIGGVVVLVPIAVCAYLIGFVVEIVYKITTPIIKWFGFESGWVIAVAPVAACILAIILCFVLGLFIQTTVGRFVGHTIERLMLRHLPGYQFLKQVSRQFVGKGGDDLGKPVLVRLGDCQQIGLLVEELPHGQVTVFVPLAPAMTLGSVLVVSESQVKRLAIPMSEALNVVGLMGYGMTKLLNSPSQ